METVVLSKKKFDSLEPLDLDKSILNSEGQLFRFSEKRKWENDPKLLKKLYINEGETFGNKLATLTSLICNKEELSSLDIVIPEKFVVVDKKLAGFTMPYIDSYNFAMILRDKKIPPQVKIEYFKQIGKLFESLENFRKYSSISDFYLNDVHEGNFIIEKDTNQVKAVDIDSCRINENKPFPTKYLNWVYIHNNLDAKYIPYSAEREKYYADENTDLFCYCIMLLNFFYGDKFYKLSIPEFYTYLQYLEDIKFPKPLLEIFSKLYTFDNNENPYEYLDELPKDFIRAHSSVYSRVRKR